MCCARHPLGKLAKNTQQAQPVYVVYSVFKPLFVCCFYSYLICTSLTHPSIFTPPPHCYPPAAYHTHTHRGLSAHPCVRPESQGAGIIENPQVFTDSHQGHLHQDVCLSSWPSCPPRNPSWSFLARRATDDASRTDKYITEQVEASRECC